MKTKGIVTGIVSNLVTVKVDGIPHVCETGAVLGDLLSRNGSLSMPCGGHGRCGKCRVRVVGEVYSNTGAMKPFRTMMRMAMRRLNQV